MSDDGEILIAAEEIDARVRELAEAISKATETSAS